MSVLRLRSPFDRQLALPFAAPVRAELNSPIKRPAEPPIKLTPRNWLRQVAGGAPLGGSAGGVSGGS